MVGLVYGMPHDHEDENNLEILRAVEKNETTAD
jgi:hypothetical protein